MIHSTTITIHEIHESAIDRLSSVIFETRNLCGDEQTAIDDFFANEKEISPVRFFPLERAAITIQATLRAYALEREKEGLSEDE